MDNSPTIRELRWEKIEKQVSMGREKMPPQLLDQWMLVLPSVEAEHFNLLLLPFVDYINSVYLMIENRREWYSKLEQKFSESEMEQRLCESMVPVITQSLNSIDREAIPHILWFIIMFFISKSGEDSCVEIFDDEKVLFVDVNMVELPNPSIQAVTHPITLH